MNEMAMQNAVEARCRAAGVWPEPLVRAWGESPAQFAMREKARQAQIKAAIAFVSAPWMGDVAGRQVAGEPDVADLWDTIQLIRVRRAAYLRALSAPKEHAEGAKLAVSESRESEGAVVGVSYDLRTEEEKAESAQEKWKEIKYHLDEISPIAVAYILDIVVMDRQDGVFPLAPVLRRLRKRLDG